MEKKTASEVERIQQGIPTPTSGLVWWTSHRLAACDDGYGAEAGLLHGNRQLERRQWSWLYALFTHTGETYWWLLPRWMLKRYSLWCCRKTFAQHFGIRKHKRVIYLWIGWHQWATTGSARRIHLVFYLLLRITPAERLWPLNEPLINEAFEGIDESWRTSLSTLSPITPAGWFEVDIVSLAAELKQQL